MSKTVLSRMSLTGVWTGKAVDRETTDEVHAMHNACKDAGNYRAELFPPSVVGADNPHALWLSAAWKVRAYHYENSIPWESPLRVVKGAKFEEYDTNMRALWTAADQAGETFFAWYEAREGSQWWEDIKAKRNGLFKESMYRDPDKLRAKWGFSLSYDPMPEAHGFITDIAGQAIARARAEFQERQDRLVREAQTHAWMTLLEPLDALARKLVDPEIVVKEQIIDGLKATIGRIPALNMTDDPILAGAANQMLGVLNTVTADDLVQPVNRLAVATQAVGLLQSFGEMGRRKIVR